MLMLKIKYPVWNGSRDQSQIGIADFRIGYSGVKFEVTYQDKFGNRPFPHVYFISRDRLIRCPTKILPSGIKVFLATIKDCEIEERRHDEN